MTDTSAETVERMAGYYNRWAKDIRAMNGQSVDADHADATADTLRALQARVAELEAGLSETALNEVLSAYEQLDDLLCCSGFDEMGQAGCGCQGATLRDEIVARILSALEPAPDARAEAWNEAIEAAVKAVNEAGYYCIPPFEETGSLPRQLDHSIAAIRAIPNPHKEKDDE